MLAYTVMHWSVSCGCNGTDQLTVDLPVALGYSHVGSLHACAGLFCAVWFSLVCVEMSRSSLMQGSVACR